MKKLLVIGFLLLLIGCVPKNIKLEGFAFYDPAPDGYLYRAITPEGVILQVSNRKNYPEKADKNFWTNAIKNYIPERGYKLIEDGETKAGKYFIFLVPGVKFDYFYFVHFYIKDDKIFLVESGGKYAYLKQYQSKILDFSSKEIKTE